MDIYLDIDGVLLANDKQAANHAHDFLEYVVTRYRVYWLTTHCRGNAKTAVERLGLVFEPGTMKLIEDILPTNWDEAKTEAIDFSRPFLWFDDDLFENEERQLIEHGVLSNWIEIDLYRDQNQLQKILSSFPIPTIVSFDTNKIITALEEYKLSQEESNTILELISVNEGAISPTLIRAHLARAYAVCARMAEKLITLGLVKALEPDVKGEVLSKDKRKGFWG